MLFGNTKGIYIILNFRAVGLSNYNSWPYHSLTLIIFTDVDFKQNWSKNYAHLILYNMYLYVYYLEWKFRFWNAGTSWSSPTHFILQPMLMSPFEGGVGGVRYFCCMHGFYHFDFGEVGFIILFQEGYIFVSMWFFYFIYERD